jgi:hypothetical protein
VDLALRYIGRRTEPIPNFQFVWHRDSSHADNHTIFNFENKKAEGRLSPGKLQIAGSLHSVFFTFRDYRSRHILGDRPLGFYLLSVEIPGRIFIITFDYQY